MKKHIYIAAPLFSEADRFYNSLIGEMIDEVKDKNGEAKYTYYLPQNNAKINDKTKCAGAVAIFDGDNEQLNNADILIVLLDHEDLGVAAEVGFFAARASIDRTLRIYGLFTDSREMSTTWSEEKLVASCQMCESQFPYVNLYLVGAIKKYGEVFSSTEELLARL